MTDASLDDDPLIVKIFATAAVLFLLVGGVFAWPLIGIPLFALWLLVWSVRIGWWLARHLIIRPIVRAGVQAAREETARLNEEVQP